MPSCASGPTAENSEKGPPCPHCATSSCSSPCRSSSRSPPAATTTTTRRRRLHRDAAPTTRPPRPTARRTASASSRRARLTIGTDKPAFPPYFEDDDPTNGKGFESAVAYAIADELGFAKAEVDWTVVPFNSSYAPGPKKFDFDINQISITREARGARRLLRAVLHRAAGGDLAQGRRRRERDEPRRAEGHEVRRPGRDDEPRRARARASSPTTSRRCSTTPTTPCARSRTAASTRSSSTCRPRSSSPRSRSRTATIVGQFEAPGGDDWGVVLEKGSELKPCVDQAITDARARPVSSTACRSSTWAATPRPSCPERSRRTDRRPARRPRGGAPAARPP